RYRHGGRTWEVEIDAGDAACLCEGERQAGPAVGPAEYRRRYWLAVDDLIQADDQRFAKAIADASQGGYDLEQAAEALGYRERPRGRAGERKAMEEAQAAVMEAQRQQQAIADEARELAALKL